jgi:hypothetical protein
MHSPFHPAVGGCIHGFKLRLSSSHTIAHINSKRKKVSTCLLTDSFLLMKHSKGLLAKGYTHAVVMTAHEIYDFNRKLPRVLYKSTIPGSYWTRR